MVIISNISVPKHIAIIMDGNGRWAKKRMLPKKLGHRQGAEALRKISRHANKLGVEALTVYAFSTENWKRSEEEVNDLMDLLEEYIQEFYIDDESNFLRVNIIGDMSRLRPSLVEKLNDVMEKSKNNDGLKMNIAINYGGRDDIVRAVKNIANDVNNKELKTDDITEELISTYLDTKKDCDPELVIRTSGEFRLSNFLLWQVAYSEFYVTDKLWPDFNNDDLEKAIESYVKRDRRFGGRTK